MKIRLMLLLFGRMPRTANLPETWYNTKNIHFCTIKDFVILTEEMGIRIERCMIADRVGRVTGHAHSGFANLLGEQGVFLLRRG